MEAAGDKQHGGETNAGAKHRDFLQFLWSIGMTLID
jgi:hypothetical protein